MRRLSAGGVPLLLMCYFLNAALSPLCCLPGRAEAVAATPSRSPHQPSLEHSKRLTGNYESFFMVPVCVCVWLCRPSVWNGVYSLSTG